MKKQMNRYMIGCLLLLVITFGCSKKEDNSNPATTTSTTTSTTGTNVVIKGTLKLHLHTYIDVEEAYSYGEYRTSDGRRITLEIAQLYISNIQLTKFDGSIYSVPDRVILQVPDIESYTVGEVPAGNYKGISFYVGLDSVTNKKIPGTSSGDVLNTPSMWFGSTAQPDGYSFLTLKGKIDTSGIPNESAVMQEFSYKIGTGMHYKKVIMPAQNYAVTPDAVATIHMYSDYSKLFNGIKINKKEELKSDTKAENANSVAAAIANNFSSMFFYEY